jgi:hypothetical protein
MISIFKKVDWLAVVIYPLAVVLMEAFWIFPWLVWLGVWHIFAESRTALSLVSVIIVLAVSLLVTRVTIRQKWSLRLIRFVVVSCGLVTMFLVLRFEYGSGYAFFDGQWFIHIGRMLGATFENPYTIVLALPVLLYLWWRGMQLGRTASYFSNVYRSFVIGMVALIVLIILWQISAGSGNFEGPISTIGLYIIAFFFFGLIALTICHLYLMRQRMPSGEALTSVWRWMPIMLGVSGGIVIIGFAAAGLFSPEFFTTVGHGIRVVFGVLGEAFQYILIPFNYLFEGIWYLLQVIVNWLRPEEAAELGMSGNMTMMDMPEYVPKEIPPIVTTVLKWLVVALIVAAVIYILVKAINRFRERHQREEIEEIHESLWSLSGLRDDLRLFLNMMGQKFKRKPRPVESHYADDDISGRLNIREIYRHLLWEAARSGVVRRSHETACEYEGRLGQYLPDGREQLNQITDLYVNVRYGEIRPQEEQVDSANGLWKALRSLLRELRGG